MVAIDLNSDLGESWGTYSKGEDEAVLSIITSANVACGYHAGDEQTMSQVVKISKKNEISPKYQKDMPWNFIFEGF